MAVSGWPACPVNKTELQALIHIDFGKGTTHK